LGPFGSWKLTPAKFLFCLVPPLRPMLS